MGRHPLVWTVEHGPARYVYYSPMMHTRACLRCLAVHRSRFTRKRWVLQNRQIDAVVADHTRTEKTQPRDVHARIRWISTDWRTACFVCTQLEVVNEKPHLIEIIICIRARQRRDWTELKFEWISTWYKVHPWFIHVPRYFINTKP